MPTGAIDLSRKGAQLRAMLEDMYQSVFADPACVPRYFSDDYVQVTDGKTIGYAEFLAHLRHLQGLIATIEFEVLDAMCDGDRLADRHVVRLLRKDGTESRHEVYLFGTVRDGRFVAVSEATCVLDGDARSKTLASATG